LEVDEPLLVDEITAARTDVLFVAMAFPKKDKIMTLWTGRHDVPVCHGVGGHLKYWSAKSLEFLQNGNAWVSNGFID